MSADTDLAKLAQLSGILPDYTDMQGQVRITGPDTQRALLKALGVAAENDSSVRSSLADIRTSKAERITPEEVILISQEAAQLEFGAGHPWVLIDMDSRHEVASGRGGASIALPPLPSGIYQLHLRGVRPEIVRVLVAPRRLPSVEGLTGASQIWGVNLALYGLSSQRNSGLGDFQDLAEMASIAAEFGAAFVGVNPIHCMGYADSSFSPYSPSHRGFLNTEHIALDRIPGLENTPRMTDILAQENTQMAALRVAMDVPYQMHKALLQRVLGEAYPIFLEEADASYQAEFRSFVEASGSELRTFAVYEALSETLGPDWRRWPVTDLPEPNEAGVAFHMWLQWLADTQLQHARQEAEHAGLSMGLYLDLAVGPRRSGAESWCEQQSVARGVSVGAPPDHLSPEGQNWDLAAFAPRKLQKANYRPLRHILSRTMRHAAVIRIDHVLGLARSFLIPDNGAPGAYVSQPLDALIAVIKIEAERNNCAVIGEDLGLVPENFRKTMRGHGFYGYSVLQYENLPVKEGHAQVLSCFATHDTPTVKGFETGNDIAWWNKLGWIKGDEIDKARQSRAVDVQKIMSLARPAPDFHSAVLAILAQSEASMISIQLDDILENTDAQNLPGTIDEHPNWRRRYQVRLEDFRSLTSFQKVAASLGSARPVQEENA